MKKLPEKLLKMIENGHYQRPEAMIKVDIEPPFVGADFEPSGSDPSFCFYKGKLYLVLIDGDYIKIVSVDPVKMTVNGLIREVLAPGAKRPRLIWEPSTHPTRPDLPHIGYTDLTGGKAMVYREYYDDQGNIVTRFDEIGIGHSTESIIRAGKYTDFYIGEDGILYMRVQGKYAEAVIVPETGEVVKSVRTMALPDSRIAILYILQKEDGREQVRCAFSELSGALELDDRFEMLGDILQILLPQSVFPFEESFAMAADTLIALTASLYPLEEQFSMDGYCSFIGFPPVVRLAEERFAMEASVQLKYVELYILSDEKFEMTCTIQELALTV